MSRRPRYCWEWPDCLCGRSWRHFQEQSESWEDGPSLPLEELEKTRNQMFHMLNCILDWCPDPKARRNAGKQLSHPVFHREHVEWEQELARWPKRRPH
jgi:hypothetical protein